MSYEIMKINPDDLDKPELKKTNEPGNQFSELINNFKFLMMNQTRSGGFGNNHCAILGSYICVRKDGITIGIPSQFGFFLCCNSFLFIEAVKSFSGEISITASSELGIVVKDDSGQVIVESHEPNMLSIDQPTSAQISCGNELIEALISVESLIDPKHEYEELQQATIKKNTCISTDRISILESWHGLDLPSDVTISKKAISLLRRSKKNLSGLSYNNGQLCFWFEDGCFLCCDSGQSKLPTVDHLFPDNAKLFSLPDQFFTTIGKVGKFSDKGHVYFHEGKVLASQNNETTMFDLEFYGDELIGVDSKILDHFAKWSKKAAVANMKNKEGMETAGKCVYFVGDRTRGVLACLSEKHTEVATKNASAPDLQQYQEKMKEWQENGSDPDNIPF